MTNINLLIILLRIKGQIQVVCQFNIGLWKTEKNSFNILVSVVQHPLYDLSIYRESFGRYYPIQSSYHNNNHTTGKYYSTHAETIDTVYIFLIVYVKNHLFIFGIRITISLRISVKKEIQNCQLIQEWPCTIETPQNVPHMYVLLLNARLALDK